MSGEQMYEMFRLLAIAKYDERDVIPTAHAEQDRQTSDTNDELVGGGSKVGRVNLLNWDGRGTPTGLFPPRHDDRQGGGS